VLRTGKGRGEDDISRREGGRVHFRYNYVYTVKDKKKKRLKNKKRRRIK